MAIFNSYVNVYQGRSLLHLWRDREPTKIELAGAKRAAQARLPHVTPRSATMCHSGRQQKKPKGFVRFEPDMAGSKVLK